ncbi:MAG: phage tail tape measure protein [Candidatus Paceibacterota bacterium]|jgi:hypothetical protein
MAETPGGHVASASISVTGIPAGLEATTAQVVKLIAVLKEAQVLMRTSGAGVAGSALGGLGVSAASLGAVRGGLQQFGAGGGDVAALLGGAIGRTPHQIYGFVFGSQVPSATKLTHPGIPGGITSEQISEMYTYLGPQGFTKAGLSPYVDAIALSGKSPTAARVLGEIRTQKEGVPTHSVFNPSARFGWSGSEVTSGGMPITPFMPALTAWPGYDIGGGHGAARLQVGREQIPLYASGSTRDVAGRFTSVGSQFREAAMPYIVSTQERIGGAASTLQSSLDYRSQALLDQALNRGYKYVAQNERAGALFSAESERAAARARQFQERGWLQESRTAYQEARVQAGLYTDAPQTVSTAQLESQLERTFRGRMGMTAPTGTSALTGMWMMQQPSWGKRIVGGSLPKAMTFGEMEKYLPDKMLDIMKSGTMTAGQGAIAKYSAGLGQNWERMGLPTDSLKGATAEAMKLNEQMSRMNNIMARTAVAFTVFYTIQNQIKGTITLARELESSLALIAGITGGVYPGQASKASRYGMQQDIFRIGKQYGIQPLQLSQSMNTAFQAADLTTREAINIAELSAEIGRGAGMPDTTPIMNILMGAKNAYGLNPAEMKEFAEQLARSRAEGVIEFGNIESGAGKVFQTSRLAGFTGIGGLSQVMALVAASTKEAGEAQNNMTMLARVFTDISDPRTQARLAKQGINYDREDPLSTLMQITRYGGSKESAQEFISTSGVFTRELSRRGLSTLASEYDYWQPRITGQDTAADFKYLESTVAATMDTSTAKMEKLSVALKGIQALVGRDLVTAVTAFYDSVIPLAGLLDKMAGKTTGGIITGGIARGLAETGTGLLAINMASMAASALLGVGGVGREKGGFALSMGDAFRSLTYKMGFGGGIAGEAALLTEQQVFNTKILEGKTRNQAMAASTLRGGMSTSAMIGGTLMWGTAATMIGSALYNTYQDVQAQKIVEKQRDYEDSLAAIRGTTEEFAPLSGIMEAGKTGAAEPKTAVSQMISEVKNLSTSTVPELASVIRSNYGNIENFTDSLITKNGELKKSYTDITTEIKNLSEEAAKQRLAELHEKTLALQKELDAQGFSFLSLLKTSWLDYAAQGDPRFRELMGGDPNKTFKETYVEKQEGKIKELWGSYSAEEKRILALFEKPPEKTLEEVETELNTKRLEQAQTLMDSLKVDLQEIEIKTKMDGQLSDLTEEQVKLKIEEQKRQKVIDSYIQLQVLDIDATTDLVDIIMNQYEGYSELVDEATESMTDINSSLAKVAESTEAVDYAMKVMNQAVKDSAQAAEFRMYGRDQTMLGRMGYLETGGALAETLTGFYSNPEVVGLAGQLVQQRVREITYKASIMNAGSTIANAAEQRKQIENEIRQLEMDYGGRITDRQNLISQGGLSALDEQKNYDEIRSLSSELSTLVTGKRFEQSKVGDAASYTAVQSVIESFLPALGGIAQVGATLRETKFDPKNRAQLSSLMSTMGVSELARSPQEFFGSIKQFFDRDFNKLPEATQKLAQPLYDLAQEVDSKKMTTWTEFFENFDALSGLISQVLASMETSWQDIIEGDLNESLTELSNQFSIMNEKATSDINPALDSVTSALNQLTTDILSLGATLRGQTLPAFAQNQPGTISASPQSMLIGPQQQDIDLGTIAVTPGSSWESLVRAAQDSGLLNYSTIYAQAKANEGGRDEKLCVAYQAQRARAMGIPVPMSVNNTEELNNYLVDELKSGLVQDISKLQYGDYVFSHKPTLKNSPAGHASMFSGLTESGNLQVFDQNNGGLSTIKAKDFRYALRPDASMVSPSVDANTGATDANTAALNSLTGAISNLLGKSGLPVNSGIAAVSNSKASYSIAGKYTKTGGGQYLRSGRGSQIGRMIWDRPSTGVTPNSSGTGGFVYEKVLFVPDEYEECGAGG